MFTFAKQYNQNQGLTGITKFNPLRAKADSFGFRRGYFLKSKKMELAEVKKYFENADLCLANFGNEFRMTKKNFKSIHQDKNEFYVDDGQFQIYSEERGFAKILTTKEPSFSITKEQLRQLTDPKVKEWFPEVFKVNLEVGKWYKSANSCCEKLIVNVVSIEGNEFTGYGIDNLGKWLNEDGWELMNPIEATEQEVFEALKNEAVRRGFVKGVFFRSAVSGDNYKFTNIYFTEATDMVWSENGGVIFQNGTWATIISTITKSEAEKLLSKKIID